MGPQLARSPLVGCRVYLVGATCTSLLAASLLHTSRTTHRAQVRCHNRYMFVGAINWASYVPRDHVHGVRGDRCGFGWSLFAALQNFGSSWGTREPLCM